MSQNSTSRSPHEMHMKKNHDLHDTRVPASGFGLFLSVTGSMEPVSGQGNATVVEVEEGAVVRLRNSGTLDQTR
jgi:hypothetical protein